MNETIFVRLLEFFDRHPSIAVASLVIVGGALLIFGLPLPKKMTRSRDGETSVTWSLDGGIPGIGRGLVEVGRGLVEFAQTITEERAAERGAHAGELAAVKATLDAVREEQMQTTAGMERIASEVRNLATQVRDLAQGVMALVARQNGDPPPSLAPSNPRASQPVISSTRQPP